MCGRIWTIITRLDVKRVAAVGKRSRMLSMGRIIGPPLLAITLRPPLFSRRAVSLEEIARLAIFPGRPCLAGRQFVRDSTRERRSWCRSSRIWPWPLKYLNYSLLIGLTTRHDWYCSARATA